MSRKIADQDDAADTEPSKKVKGAIFVKNQVNELIEFEDGTTYKFQNSREVITDKALAENLRNAKPQYGIFEVAGDK